MILGLSVVSGDEAPAPEQLPLKEGSRKGLGSRGVLHTLSWNLDHRMGLNRLSL